MSQPITLDQIPDFLPRKTSGSKKNASLNLRLNMFDRAALHTYCQKRGLTVTEWFHKHMTEALAEDQLQ